MSKAHSSALVKPVAKMQALKSTRQRHLIHTLCKGVAEGQALKTLWKIPCTSRAPPMSSNMASWASLELNGNLNRIVFYKCIIFSGKHIQAFFYYLIQEVESQVLLSCWILGRQHQQKQQKSEANPGFTPCIVWSKWPPKVKSSRAAGNVTASNVWLKCLPKVNFCRPAGAAGCQRDRTGGSGMPRNSNRRLCHHYPIVNTRTH